MRLETFFEKFDQLAEAPNAVAKMRELVLQLAVQGKLVESIDGDEPVEFFLRRIWTSQSDNRIELKDAEKPQPFGLPAHWRWVVLAEVANFSIGKTPPRGDSSYWYPEDHSWVSIADMKHYGTITETREKVSSLAAQQVFRHRFAEPGSILMSFKLTIGKVARAGIRCFHNEAIISLSPPEPELADYLFRCLPIFAALQTSNNAIKGSTLNKGLLTLLPIALPPLAEQKRIVAKVDELMALCDRLETQQQERDTRHAALARASLARFAEAPTPANLEFLFHKSYTITPADLRQTILNLAVQGKLVPQDPNDESAKDCLSRLGLKTTFASENNSNELNNTLPSSWARVRFEDIAVIAGGVTLGRKLAGRKTVALPYLRVANVKRGQIDLSIIKKVSIAENEIERYALRENDLLMTEGGDWDKVGRAAIWKAQIPICLHQNHIFRARMRSAEITPVWFERYFNSPDGRSYFEFASKQTTNLASINMRQVRGCPVLFPPLAEQRRIIAKVDQLMALVDQLETQLTTAQIESGHLLEAILHEILNPVSSDDNARGEPDHPEVIPLSKSKPTACRPNRHLARALLSAEIVHQLHAEPTFGRTKHQKILHLCEYIARVEEVDGEYHRDAAGPLDNRMMYSVAKELKKQHWYEEYPREKFGNAYRPLEKAGQHRKYLERYWPDKLPVIQRLLDMMRTWDTDRCEIFSTTYAAWNDLLIWKQEPTEAPILKEILERWHEKKKRFSEERWRKEIAWMRKEGFIPTGFGRATRKLP